jgi:hypothetical protein
MQTQTIHTREPESNEELLLFTLGWTVVIIITMIRYNI